MAGGAIGPLGLLPFAFVGGAFGPLGVGSAAAAIAARAQYDKTHVYSTAPEAVTKRAIDLKIMGGDYSRGGDIRIDSEPYLKQLIELASNGKQKVKTNAGKNKLQFFIIRGGAEGFLPDWLAGQNASDVLHEGATKFRFDYNDLLAVFDSAGNLMSSARLERPLLVITKFGTKSQRTRWTPETAEKVYSAWNGKGVFVYRNKNFGTPYVGIGIWDGMRGKVATVDLHKQEGTLGCIMIDDPNTPVADDDPTTPDGEALDNFEPALIEAVLKKIGVSKEKVKGHIDVGTMHVVKIK